MSNPTLVNFDVFSDRARRGWFAFAAACGATELRYSDLGNGEDYTLVWPSGPTLTLQVRGNKADGGFASVSQEAPRG